MNCEFLNMKTMKLTCLVCVALLSSIIQGGGSSDRNSDGKSDSDNGDSISDEDEDDSYEALYDIIVKVNGIIENDETINNIFKPLEFLNMGGFSVSYRGELGQSKKIVAMKISPISMVSGDPEDEYIMYTYMRAINNATVEDYGIPAVYYYCADWEGSILLALTLLEPQYNRIIQIPNIRLGDLDILIIMREFVRITKYIHSCGVCHADAHKNNIMFRKNQGFIIDFNLSVEVIFGVGPYSDCRKMDWRRFFIGLCYLCGLPIDRFPYVNTLKNIENMKNNDGLRFVLMNFAIHAFKTENADPINYNQMHQVITEEIHRRGVQEPALVSWLTDAQKNEARVEWSRRQTPAIETIDEPKTQYTYPEPIFDYFHEFI